ncbi:MAG: hypothetical protein GY807_24890 [Gammaproteobacteria bacterium]|nr:hypothetical protein [Gammaproteobacteria bacterium]
MSDLQNYFYRQEQTGRARVDSARADAVLKNASINERLAEIKSQHEPLAGLSGVEDILDPEYQIERAKMYAAAHYVVHGRMPVISERAVK